MPMVSVIIPCYNQAQYLPDALDSVLKQTYPYWECIIVNDGSPDNTEEVAMEWVKKDNRFKYLKKENGGLSSARNAGLTVANGKYMQFLDADDVIHPKKFEIQVNNIADVRQLALSHCDYFSSIEDDLNMPHPNRYLSPAFYSDQYVSELITRWEKSLSIPCHCFLFDSRFFKEKKIQFDENLPNHEDWECWMNIFSLHPEVIYINEKLATYRIRSEGMCYNAKLMKKGYLMAIIKQCKIKKYDPYIFNLIKTRYSEIKSKPKKKKIFHHLYSFINRLFYKIKRKILKNIGWIYKSIDK